MRKNACFCSQMLSCYSRTCTLSHKRMSCSHMGSSSRFLVFLYLFWGLSWIFWHKISKEKPGFQKIAYPSPTQQVVGLSPYPLESPVQLQFILIFFILSPSPNHFTLSEFPMTLFSFFFFTERLIVAEEFYAENLKTALKNGKAFRWVFIKKLPFAYS